MTILSFPTEHRFDLRRNNRQMEANMGMADRWIRLMVAAVVVLLYFTGVIEGALGIALMLFGAVFAITSFMSFCPIYAAFRFNTRGTAKRAN